MRTNHTLPQLRRRLPRLLIGLVLCAWGIAAGVTSDLGLGPWDVLHQGLSVVIGVPIGVVTIVVGLVVFSLWIPLRERPGVGTIANMLAIGLVLDLTLLWLQTPETLLMRTLMMLGGILLFAVGSGFYIGAGLGPGPRDGVMTGLARRGWPVGLARATIELSALGVGWFFGGTVGVGTVLFALAIGPLVHWLLPLLSVADAASTPVPPGLRSAR